MGYRSNCDLCGESYDSDNLASCVTCGREYCYRCGSSGTCSRCATQDAPARPPGTERATSIEPDIPERDTS